MKKVLAIIISLSMCMSLAVSPALATNISKIDSKQTSHNSLLASKSTIDLSQSNDTVTPSESVYGFSVTRKE